MKILALAAEALLLGLSTGTYCAMYCVPVLLPFLAGTENNSLKKTSKLLGLFLGGRLFTYAALGLSLGAAGMFWLNSQNDVFNPVLARNLSVIAYIVCGTVLLANFGARRKCAGPRGKGGADKTGAAAGAGTRSPAGTGTGSPAGTGTGSPAVTMRINDSAAALLAGLSVGLHICPPYWTACVRAASSSSAAAGLMYFVLFYIGTLPFFAPLLGIPFLTKLKPSFIIIARISQALVGIYLLFFAGLLEFFF